TVRQAVTLRLQGAPAEVQGQAHSAHSQASRVEAVEERAPVLVLEDAPNRPLPRIGLGLASHGQPLTPQAVDRLKWLRPAHLRADLWLGEPEMAATLRRAAEEAQALETALELALFLPEDVNRPAEPALRELAGLVEALQAPVWAWLVFNRRTRTSDETSVALARRILGLLLPEARFGGGADLFFTELNRYCATSGAAPAGLDFLCYSINPQVHAFDNSSLVETLVAQAATVESALALSGGLPVAVTPVTLRMRANPNATGPEPPPPPGELPPQVDPRQMSLFGAGWTLGSLKYLSLSGVYSLTYYETTGWRGVMETEAGSPLPTKFPSLPGAVFPLYHVLADVAEFAGGEATGATSNQPLVVDGFSLHHGERRRTLVANLSPEPQTVVVRNLSAAQAEMVQVVVLDEDNMLEAMTEPEGFRTRPPQGLPLQNGVLRLPLKPYAVARIDAG
ncbi:MAG TPA: hypothetical protein VNK95_19115, partial [Caldilineaceae bacterium]|nr:hypothetical protein [Caldilineaceae bacterium]